MQSDPYTHYRIGLVLMLPLTSVKDTRLSDSLPGMAVHPLPKYWFCKKT